MNHHQKIKQYFKNLYFDNTAELHLDNLLNVRKLIKIHYDALVHVILDITRMMDGVDIYYCLDFSDIYMISHPGRSVSNFHRLVQFYFLRLDANMLLLPGTIYEIYKHYSNLRILSGYRDDLLSKEKLDNILRNHLVNNYLKLYDKISTLNSEEVQENDLNKLNNLYYEIIQKNPILEIIEEGETIIESSQILIKILKDPRIIKIDEIIGDNILKYRDIDFKRSLDKITKERPDFDRMENNIVDAKNYAEVLELSNIFKNEKYFTFLTASERPYKAFKEINWESDPFQNDDRILFHNFSNARNPIYTLYLIGLYDFYKGKDNLFRTNEISKIKKLCLLLHDIHIEIEKYVELFEPTIAQLRRNKYDIKPRGKFLDAIDGGSLYNNVKLNRNLISKIRSITNHKLFRYLDKMSDELEITRTSDENRKILNRHKLFAESLLSKTLLKDSLHFSYNEIYSKNIDFLEELKYYFCRSTKNKNPKNSREIKYIDKTISIMSNYFKDYKTIMYHKLDNLVMLKNPLGEELLTIENWPEYISIYWPTNSDFLHFIKVIDEIVVATNKIKETRNIKFKNISKKWKSGILLENKDGNITYLEFNGNIYDYENLFIKWLESNHNYINFSSNFKTIRIVSDYFDAWYELDDSLNSSLRVCGVLTHLNLYYQCTYIYFRTRMYYPPENDVKNILAKSLSKYPIE